MSQFKFYISQLSTVTVEADFNEKAEVLAAMALELYNTNSPEVERFKPEIEEVESLPPEAA